MIVMPGFRYGQFGEGFSRTRESAAIRFGSMVARQGESITVIKKTISGYDEYGDPEYTEESYSLNAFIEESGRERIIQPGDIKVHELKLFFAKWAPVEEDLYELELLGFRHHILSVVEARAYRLVKAERVI